MKTNAKKRSGKGKGKGEKRPLRLEWVEAASLADNPDNWRRHPQGQTKALKGMLDDVGWAGALLFNETTGRLIDGHARKKAVAPKTIVPVLVGRWSEQQELKILATLDPLASMAIADGDALESLLAEVDLESDSMAELSAMLDKLVEDFSSPPGDSSSPARKKPPAADKRKRGPKVMRFVLGQFTFDISRQAYDTWLSKIEAKTGSDADQVIKELKRRLKL